MVQLQRKYLLLTAIVCGLFALGLAQPAGAVINGTADGTGHRYVGAHVVLNEAGGVRQVVPSGVLVAPTVMVVAGHSVFFGNAGSLAEQGRLFVSFAPTVDPTSTAGLIKVIHAEGLFPTLDLGIFVLAEPAHDALGSIPPAKLPTVGLLDQLAAAHELHGLPLTLVGYGASAMVDNTTPDFATFGTRRSGLQRAQALPNGQSEAPFGTFPLSTQLMVSTNVTTPDPVGPGIGDSGGPCLLGGSDTVVGIVSFLPGPPNSGLAEAGVWAATRLDTPEARAFLARFGVPLP